MVESTSPDLTRPVDGSKSVDTGPVDGTTPAVKFEGNDCESAVEE